MSLKKRHKPLIKQLFYNYKNYFVLKTNGGCYYEKINSWIYCSIAFFVMYTPNECTIIK